MIWTPASTSTAAMCSSPRCLQIFPPLLGSVDQPADALDHGRPQGSGQIVAHTVDHNQLRSWNRLCGRLPAAHSNELVLSTVNNKGRQVEPVQVFGAVWVAMAAAS